MSKITDFKFCWLNDERTKLSVRYTGAIPTVIDQDGMEIEDAGLVKWPSDSEISKACGKEVVFADAGEDLTEAIFRTASKNRQHENMRALGIICRCRMDKTTCPHGCEPQSPNCMYNLLPTTNDSKCPYRNMN